MGGTSPLAAQVAHHERAISDAYSAWVETVNEKDLDAWGEYLAPEALFLPPNSPALSDRSEILEFYAALFADEQFSLDCRQEGVEVAGSEDIAWSFGYCSSTSTAPDGALAHGDSKWTKVWRRMPSGAWKCAMNSWSPTN
jgi:ketosteroid isomerase-like protein